MMKPKGATEHETGLLEYIEDLIGSNRLKEGITEAEKQVEELNEERTQKLNRVKMAENECDNLRSGKLEAEQYVLKQHTLLTLQYKHGQAMRFEAGVRAKEAEDQQEQLKRRAEELTAAVKEYESEVDSVRGAYNEKKAAVEAATQSLAAVKEEFDSFERKDVKFRENIKHSKAQKKKLAANLEKERTKLIHLQSEVRV